MAQKATETAIRELQKLIQVLTDKVTSLVSTVNDQNAVILKQSEAINQLRVQVEGKQTLEASTSLHDGAASAQAQPATQRLVRQARLTAAAKLMTKSAAAAAKNLTGGKNRQSIGDNNTKRDEVRECLPTSIPATAAATGPVCRVTKIAPDTVRINQVTDNTDEDDSIWQKVGRKRQTKPRRVLTGSGKTDDVLQTVEQIKYIQVWSFKPETTEDNVKNHLIKLAKCDNYLVEKRVIKTDKHAAFVIGFPQSLYDVLSSPQSWPQGVKLSDWFRWTPRRAEGRGSLTTAGCSDNTSTERSGH